METRPRDLRLRYGIALAAVIVLGLASRQRGLALPPFLAKSAGDTLYAVAAYFFVALLRPAADWRRIAALSLAFCYLIEFSQIYHAPWIDGIRRTLPGRLILGFGFSWTDQVCYTVGVILAALLDHALIKKSKT